MKLVTEEKLSLPEAARRLSIASSALSYWFRSYKGSKLGEIGKTQRSLTEKDLVSIIDIRDQSEIISRLER